MIRTDIYQLEILITEHHEMYNNLFGDLKPQFHMMIHSVSMALKIVL